MIYFNLCCIVGRYDFERFFTCKNVMSFDGQCSIAFHFSVLFPFVVFKLSIFSRGFLTD